MPRDALLPKGKRGRPRKNPLPDTPIECVNLKPVVEDVENSVEDVDNSVEDVDNSNDNPNEMVTVNDEPTEELTPSPAEKISPTKKKNSPDPNQICMACGTVIPDTPRKIELASCFDVAPYRFNTKLNEKGRIILCPKCSNNLVDCIDKKLKELGCKQKYDVADYPND